MLCILTIEHHHVMLFYCIVSMLTNVAWIFRQPISFYSLMYKKHCSKLLIYLLCLVGLKLLKCVWNDKVVFTLWRETLSGDLGVNFIGVAKGGFVHMFWPSRRISRLA